MSKGLDVMLERLGKDYRPNLVRRYLDLVNEIGDADEKARRSLALAKTILPMDSGEALRIAGLVHKSGQKTGEALDLMIMALRARGKFAKAEALRKQRDAEADGGAANKLSPTGLKPVGLGLFELDESLTEELPPAAVAAPAASGFQEKLLELARTVADAVKLPVPSAPAALADPPPRHNRERIFVPSRPAQSTEDRVAGLKDIDEGTAVGKALDDLFQNAPSQPKQEPAPPAEAAAEAPLVGSVSELLHPIEEVHLTGLTGGLKAIADGLTGTGFSSSGHTMTGSRAASGWIPQDAAAPDLEISAPQRSGRILSVPPPASPVHQPSSPEARHGDLEHRKTRSNHGMTTNKATTAYWPSQTGEDGVTDPGPVAAGRLFWGAVQQELWRLGQDDELSAQSMAKPSPPPPPAAAVAAEAEREQLLAALLKMQNEEANSPHRLDQLWQLATALWAAGPDDTCLEFLRRSRLAHRDLRFFGLYLDALLSTGRHSDIPMVAWQALRSTGQQTRLPWALSAYRRLRAAWDRLGVRPQEWHEDQGVAALIELLQTRPAPSMASLISGGDDE